MEIKFIAELKQTRQLKMVSGDNEYKVVLVTDDPRVLDLGKLPADRIFDVVIGSREVEEYGGEHNE